MEAKIGNLVPEVDVNSVTYINRLFMMSYPFSQGLVSTQRDIFRYLHAKRPDISIDEATFIKLDELSFNRVSKFFRGILLDDLSCTRNIIHMPYHVAPEGSDELIEPITRENMRRMFLRSLSVSGIY